MKKIVNFSIILLTFGVLMVQMGCNDEWNPLVDNETGEDIDLFILDPNFYNTTLFFTFVDSETGELLTGKNVVFQLTGDKSGDIVDIAGTKGTEYSTKEGVMMLALDPNIKLSESNSLNLNINAYTDDVQYFSYGDEISYTVDGDYSIQIQLTSFFSMKSLYADDYELLNTFDGTDVSTLNTWLTRSIDTEKNGKFYYDMLFPASVVTGTLNSELVRGESSYLSSYGFDGFYNGASIDAQSLEVNDASGPSDRFQTYIQLADFERCAEGVDITITNSILTEGTSTVNYVIEYYDDVDGTWNVCKEGIVTHDGFPYTINSGVIYYPSSSSQFRFSASSNEQYEIVSSAQTVSSLCGADFSVELSAREELHQTGVNIIIRCEDDNTVLLAPTMKATFTKVGTNDPFIVQLDGGQAVLNIEPMANYVVNASYGGEMVNFEFSFDDSKIDEVIEQNLEENEDLSKVEWEKVMHEGIMYYNLQVYFKSSACPL